MEFWKVTIKQMLPRKRYSLHQFVVAAEGAEAAKLLVLDEYGVGEDWSIEAEPVEPGEVIRGRASVHRVVGKI